MDKKGFTLFEVIVSVVLISIILTSMLATLVRLKDSYEIVYENTDALIYSSSIARIMNNDFEKNGGIRYIDCNYDGNICDITLNNNQKRTIEIYNAYIGNLVDNTTKTNKDGSADYENKLKYYIVGSNTAYDVESSDKIYCEPTEFEGIKGIHAECGKADTDSPVTCTCAKQIMTTTLRYSDTTDLTNTNNIYLKTLSLEKLSELDKSDGKYISTGQSSTLGYNFGKISFTNMTYDSSTRFTDSGTPYKNSISTITIEINDGIDTLDSTYNINLSSSSSYSPEKTQIGKTLCFNFYNYNENATKIEHSKDALCVKFGVGFYLKEAGELTKVEKLNPSTDFPVITPNTYTFEGYYYDLGGENETLVIDKNGNIKISTTHFSDDTGIDFQAKWQ